jgi:uncharacterized membrane protein YfcA
LDILQTVEIGVVAAVAAVLGSMLGLGGGVFLVPIITLFFGIDPRIAVGASAVVVVTNSVGRLRRPPPQPLHQPPPGDDPPGHDRPRRHRRRPRRRQRRPRASSTSSSASSCSTPPPRWPSPAPTGRPRLGADPLRLGAAFRDPATATDVAYVPKRIGLGLGVSSGAGVLSGMLGVGGGVVMVPTMNLLMNVPVKAAVGTSTFMVGITSVATAFVFYANGFVDPTVVVPAVVGVFLGGQIGPG